MTIEKSKVLYLYIRTDKMEIIFAPLSKDIENSTERDGDFLELSAFNTWDRLCPKG